MAFIKYLTLYSGKEDPEEQLESYESDVKSGKWTTSQIIECVDLKLKWKTKDQFSNFTREGNSKTWELS